MRDHRVDDSDYSVRYQANRQPNIDLEDALFRDHVDLVPILTVGLAIIVEVPGPRARSTAAKVSGFFIWLPISGGGVGSIDSTASTTSPRKLTAVRIAPLL